MNLVDSSALLCFLQEETGAARVEEALSAGGRCSAVDATVWTADAAWGRDGRVRQVR